jgi:hypothetical protein
MITRLFSIITIFTSLFFFTNSFAQDSTNVTKKYFGLSLQPNFQGMITYAIIEINEKKGTNSVNRIFLSKRDWLHQIVGIQQSIANPDEKNILKDAGLEGPDILDEVWKLRYSETPYAGSTIEKGWAGKPTIPTEGQMEMLRQFGIKTISDYFYGENLLKLLKAMEDPGWVSEYQNK